MSEHKTPKSQTWLVVMLICGFVLAYGAVAFLFVGIRPPAAWDYGGVNEVPGGSAYSTHGYFTAYLEKSPVTSFLMWLSIDFERMRRTAAGQQMIKTYYPEYTTTRHLKLDAYRARNRAAADKKFGG
ncbi:MAG: hypothetical protein P9L99_13200 [Candidatus Lernaella stagnicola]|nr:hypothetical protein [Candidatus Lernaella stagnicola]